MLYLPRLSITIGRMSTTGKLKINSLKLQCILVVYPEERLNPQPVSLDIEIETDFQKTYGRQDTQMAVDWHSLANEIEQFMDQQFYLVETACIEVCRLVLSKPHALSTQVSITKTHCRVDCVTGGFTASFKMAK